MIMKTVFLVSLLVIIAVIFVHNKNLPIDYSSSTTTTTVPTTTTSTTTTTTTTTTIPFLGLNLTAPMTLENLRWEKLPINVYIDNKSCTYLYDDVSYALRIWETKTVVDFKVVNNQDYDSYVYVSCWKPTEVNRTVEEGYIYTTLGEAQITEYYSLEQFNIINKAEVNIARTTVSCIKPIRIIHEFGHILGLNHVSDRNSVMYKYEDCSQIITDEMKQTMSELYSEEVNNYLEILE